MHSSLPLAYLRVGNGDPLRILESREPSFAATGAAIATWDATEAMPWAGRLHVLEGGAAAGQAYALWADDHGWYQVDPGRGAIVVPADVDPIAREERLWGIPAMLCFMARGDIPLHAAAVEVDGRAVIITAPSRGGKTTLAVAFAQAGHRLLSEDVTCIRPSPAPSVVPGPAMLRVRQDVATWGTVPGASVVAEDARRHLALDRATRGDCAPVPIAAIFVLRDGPGRPRIERRGAAAILPDLWAQTSHLPTKDGRARSFAALVDAVRAVPIMDLHRDLQAVGPAEIVDLMLRRLPR